MHNRRLPVPLLSLLLLVSPLAAQTYTVGSTVSDYTFTDYTTGQQVTLYELGADGGVLVLEWFAYWCPFCANAAANVETGIVEYYAARNGNPHGVPVRHIALNVQGGARTQSDAFIAAYGLTTVLEDYQRSFFNLFSPGGGQPLFVIINAEKASPGAEQWEVLYTRLNYLGNAAPDISALMRPVIDSIEASVVPPPTLEETFPQIRQELDGWWYGDWFGWLSVDGFPYVFHYELGFLYARPAPDGGLLAWLPGKGWFHTGQERYPFLFSLESRKWVYFDAPSGQLLTVGDD